MNDPVSYTTAFLIGLLGGAHCIGMCGGIINALSFAIPAEQRTNTKLNLILLAYNTGRIFSYTVAGAIIGGFGWWLQASLGDTSFFVRIFAGVMLIVMGLYLAGWWFGLRHTESAGNHIWKLIEPFGKRFMPVENAKQGLVLGAIWGWLPCGMVYSVLTWSATASAGGWQQSALIMLCFGLGTLPVMFVTGRFAHKLKSFVQKKWTRNIAAMFMIGFGVWTIVGANQFSGHHNHTQIQPNQESGSESTSHPHNSMQHDEHQEHMTH